DFPSTNDHLPEAARPPTPDHFASFLAEAWEPKSQRVVHAVPERWQRAWAVLADASGLPLPDCDAFASDCRLDFAYRLPDDQLDGPKTAGASREVAAWK